MAAQPVFRRERDTVPNALDIARDTFSLLVTGPDPVSLNGRLYPGLPDRRLPLDEVRDRLLARQCPQATRDAVWAHLVLRARTDSPTWTLAAVGVALPALTTAAARLSKRFAGDPGDVHAEVLRGFLTAVATVDLRRPRIMVRLRWTAYRSGYAALAEALGGPIPVALGYRSAPPHPPWGHPDLVLARAVADGVLTRTQADLIGITRLESLSLADWAAARNMTVWAAYKMRERAEARLLRYLRDAAVDQDDTDPVTAQVFTSLALTHPTAPTHVTPGLSPSVDARPDAHSEKVRVGMSKTGPKSGVQGCGSNPRSARLSDEVPACA
ncbi:hypothetical protein [Actinocrispum wychmicini]|uniref:Uncharacterized protein n=1 Tax=Actinocrispum wychmicini TaxID=1213861 RepID=A0A4R2IYZ4_9PSEU|nr:hypothetical protein [Actinocrispum wychmicini]TCO49686.1 hypothetical protein EV192_11452 [Actinocrispum wychmicini]